MLPLGRQPDRSVWIVDQAFHRLNGRQDERPGASSSGVDAAVLEGPPKGGWLSTVRALRRLIREVSPDLLLTYNWGAIDAVVAAQTLRFTRVVHHEDGFNADEAVGFKRRRVWVRRLVLPRVRRVIVPSRRLERVALDVWRLAPSLVATQATGTAVLFKGPGGGNTYGHPYNGVNGSIATGAHLLASGQVLPTRSSTGHPGPL